jgi:PIN domain nuclease of toxin-antitoxin system
MDIVIDTSALIAVIVDERERSKIIELTSGNTLIGLRLHTLGNRQCLFLHV